LDLFKGRHFDRKLLQSAKTITRRISVRSTKYLNNVVEQDHRRINHCRGKQRVSIREGAACIDLERIDASIKQTHAINWSLGVERKLPGDGVAYINPSEMRFSRKHSGPVYHSSADMALTAHRGRCEFALA
jgi:hypothetical protein